jgi:hypothetical protein
MFLWFINNAYTQHYPLHIFIHVPSLCCGIQCHKWWLSGNRGVLLIRGVGEQFLQGCISIVKTQCFASWITLSWCGVWVSKYCVHCLLGCYCVKFILYYIILYYIILYYIIWHDIWYDMIWHDVLYLNLIEAALKTAQCIILRRYVKEMQQRHPDSGRSCIAYHFTACSVTYGWRGMLR